jgi:16S rRNA (guanine1516-N2)-methyltransferase
LITIAVAATDSGLADEARQLAEKLSLPLLAAAVSPRLLSEPEAILFVSPQGLYIQRTGRVAPGPVAVHFGSSAMRHRRRAGQNELLGRAVGVGKKRQLQVLDATAGLGRDAFVLADSGCMVYLCERHPLVYELLASGLQQARAGGDNWLQSVCARMYLSPGDARQFIPPAQRSMDVIYLDPMFPVRQKSASVKKEMALFQALLEVGGTPVESDDLLLWALDQSVARVVVKRPVRAPLLCGKKPSHVMAGKAVRYDVYVLSPFTAESKGEACVDC